MHPIDCRCAVCLVDRSSFGTPEAKALRASVSDEQAARVVQRSRELDAGNAGTDPLAEDRMFVAEELRDALVETTLSYGDRNRAAWALVDWFATHDAQVRADERQKVAALLADEGTVEKVARHVYDEAGFHAADTWDTEGSINRDRYREDARAALAAIAGLLDEEAGK